MKQLILLAIRLYWVIIPAAKRRKCVFNISCSKYVYQATSVNGFHAGVRAFKYRFQNCRSGCEIFNNPINGHTQMLLPCGDIIDEQEVSAWYLRSIDLQK
ncbi:membrane protein insertion efficiency factor YidD [Chitinophaga skermanii]|uniref:membrane protein insertion efficiency factor YidD n=1 Tax=Chitinophaga skermanii TaxID=331697 RepID=UPI000DB94F3A